MNKIDNMDNMDNIDNIDTTATETNKIDNDIENNILIVDTETNKSNNIIEHNILIDADNDIKKIDKNKNDNNEIIVPFVNKGDIIPHRSFLDIMNTMNTKFSYQDGKLSNALNIISFYLKGQKMLYLEAKSYCEFYLYRLMMPAIFISSASSVISGVFSNSSSASKLVAGATALNTLILSLINYFKLDAKAEAHKMTAYSFDQLISECEFTSGKILLSNVSEKSANDKAIKYDLVFVQNYINDIEKRVKDIKEKNQFIIPEKIRHRYPIIYNKNIFMEVLKTNIDEMKFCNELKVIYNKEIDIENKIIKGDNDKQLYDLKENMGLMKNKKIEDILEYRKNDNNYIRDVMKELTNHKKNGLFAF